MDLLLFLTWNILVLDGIKKLYVGFQMLKCLSFLSSVTGNTAGKEVVDEALKTLAKV